ncbi:MAG: ATP-binding protein [Hyphomicrobiales bacterium]
MADVTLKQKIEIKSATPIERLWEARWLLAIVAVQFALIHKWWQADLKILILFFALIVGAAVFAPRRQHQVVSVDDTVKSSVKPLKTSRHVRRIMDAIPEPVLVLDRDGVIQHTNQPLRTIFNPIRNGDPFTMKFRDPDVIAALAKVQKTGASASVPHRERVQTDRHYLIQFSPVHRISKDEIANTDEPWSPDLIFVTFLEQTERVRLDELRSDFIANVSHELRTPVASLTGFIETLLGPAKDDEANRERFLNIMLEQAQRMGRLINDLLSLSRIEMHAHVSPTEKVDLRNVAQHVADALAPLASDVNLRIDLEMDEGELWVRGDSDELVQAVQNLVENACKYGEGGESVLVSVKNAPWPDTVIGKGKSCYCIRVRDFGQGIEPQHLPRLTERFYRVDAEESKRKLGTGLGLAVVKHVLMRHQSELRVSSIKDEGATFEFHMMKYQNAEKSKNIK